MKITYTLILFFLLTVCFCFVHLSGFAQIRISGTVYDMSRRLTLPAVSVVSTSGAGTTTDANGFYAIVVGEKDSIWFSYLNRPTPKFAVAVINTGQDFDISLHVPVTELKEVSVIPRNYKFDSAQNRLAYAKAFDFQKPGIRLSAPASGNFGVGLDLNELINMFSFKKNRRMLAFQRRLIEEEQEKSIDHRFTKAFVKKITLANSPVLEDFMKKYRPSFEFTISVTDYEFAEYIKLAWLDYKSKK